jgi:nonspecific dipeptidase
MHYSFIDENHDAYIKRLSDAVAIRSVSAWPQHRAECQEMIDWTEKRLKKLGVETQQYEIGKQTLPDGKHLKLPNVILGDFGNVKLIIFLKYDFKIKF